MEIISQVFLYLLKCQAKGILIFMGCYVTSIAASTNALEIKIDDKIFRINSCAESFVSKLKKYIGFKRLQGQPDYRKYLINNSVEEELLLEAIRRNRFDNLLPGVYADWLEDAGLTARAELIRNRLEFNRLADDLTLNLNLKSNQSSVIRQRESNLALGLIESFTKEIEVVRGMARTITTYDGIFWKVTTSPGHFAKYAGKILENFPLIRSVEIGKKWTTDSADNDPNARDWFALGHSETLAHFSEVKLIFSGNNTDWVEQQNVRVANLNRQVGINNIAKFLSGLRNRESKLIAEHLSISFDFFSPDSNSNIQLLSQIVSYFPNIKSIHVALPFPEVLHEVATNPIYGQLTRLTFESIYRANHRNLITIGLGEEMAHSLNLIHLRHLDLANAPIEKHAFNSLFLGTFAERVEVFTAKAYQLSHFELDAIISHRAVGKDIQILTDSPDSSWTDDQREKWLEAANRFRQKFGSIAFGRRLGERDFFNH